jgi:hypothetical protein
LLLDDFDLSGKYDCSPAMFFTKHQSSTLKSVSTTTIRISYIDIESTAPHFFSLKRGLSFIYIMAVAAVTT